MATQKLYAGVKLRELRGRLRLTQKAFAHKLDVSLPYLNQMENNNRPISAGVVLALAQEFGLDVTELTTGDSERIVTDMREALADPVFTAPPPYADLRLAASNAPALARAFLICTAPTAKAMSVLPVWMRHWGAAIPPLRHPHGRKCEISFIIATTTSMRLTVPRNAMPPKMPLICRSKT